jgi:hypothetical protein
MRRGFEFRRSNVVLALALMVAGGVILAIVRTSTVAIGGRDVTSIALLVGGLVFYSGIIVIFAMFHNETYLAIALLMPSIVAIAVFVYGFIGWSIRVSLSRWKGLTPDFTFVGLKQYTDLIQGDPRFAIDVRNTAVFTVGLPAALSSAWGWPSCWTNGCGARQSSAGSISSRWRSPSSPPAWCGDG